MWRLEYPRWMDMCALYKCSYYYLLLLRLPTRKTPYQDDSQLGQLSTRISPYHDDSPLGQLPPGQLPTRTTPQRTVLIAVLCPSPGCQIRVRVRVRVITSESESESSPQSPSPSPSHHLRVRVRVRESESKKKSSPSHESSSPHIQHFVYLPKHENKQQNVSNVSATRHGRYCLDSGVTRVTIFESESESE